MNLLFLVMTALALLPAEPPTFTPDSGFPPSGVVTWQGPGELRALHGGDAHTVATSAVHGAVETPVAQLTTSVLYCAIRAGEPLGCVIVPPSPDSFVFVPLVTS